MQPLAVDQRLFRSVLLWDNPGTCEVPLQAWFNLNIPFGLSASHIFEHKYSLRYGWGKICRAWETRNQGSWACNMTILIYSDIYIYLCCCCCCCCCWSHASRPPGFPIFPNTKTHIKSQNNCNYRPTDFLYEVIAEMKKTKKWWSGTICRRWIAQYKFGING